MDIPMNLYMPDMPFHIQSLTYMLFLELKTCNPHIYI